MGYGLLRYLSKEGVSSRWGMQLQAQVSFNYLGQLDQVLSAAGMFQAATESAGAERGARGQRNHMMEISAAVQQGRLQVAWIYSAHLHRRGTIEEVAGSYLRRLALLITHCQSPQAGGYTPSDFPLVRLNQVALDSLVEAAGKNIENLYPLSPMQEGLLLHSLYSPEAGMYFEQMNCSLEGEFDLEVFERAWQRVVDRHGVLRSSFAWEGLKEPVQVVQEDVKVKLEGQDWRDLDAGEQPRRLEAFLKQDRERGFDLRQAPLMRAHAGPDFQRAVSSPMSADDPSAVLAA